ncbi:MAG TPA: von Willebrand factor type A domain-containing protein, partial [Rubricoccaceae bacterium]
PGLSMRFVAAVLLLGALAPPAHAQATGTLAGAVLEEDGVTTVIGATVRIDGTSFATATDIDGNYRIIGVPVGTYSVTASYTGYPSQTRTDVHVMAGATRQLNFTLSSAALEEVVVTYEAPFITNDAIGAPRVVTDATAQERGTRRAEGDPLGRDRTGYIPPSRAVAPAPPPPPPGAPTPADALPYYVDGVRVVAPADATWQDRGVLDGEDYAAVGEIGFRRVEAAPLSTFSIDVDRASYANVRRMLTDGYLPPPDAVRVEEFVNAFELGMAGPSGGAPFAVHTEVGPCPWAPAHRLVRVGVQGRRVDVADLPPANLVFLLDVSGSMGSADKLPLLVTAFRRLVGELRPQDRVAIVVYAGAAGLVLPPTSGADKATILAALDRLQAGGSTAGAAGIELAYAVARQHFDPAATNRVLLATDGDFNVGVTGEGALQRLVERERASGVMLSVFGLGTGNLQDARMEALASWGNGAYSYLDSAREAERVFVREIGGTLVAIAKDVKVQVEFNPAAVAGYRLVGYDNRALPDEAFADDAHDAAELGMGHHVTALYEVVPAGADESGLPPAQRLRYQRQSERGSDDLLTVQLRYKPATGPGTFADRSVLLTVPLMAPPGMTEPSEAMAWTTAVAEAALVLRESAHAPGATLAGALARARAAVGRDADGDRAEFVDLVERAAALADRRAGEQAQAVLD